MFLKEYENEEINYSVLTTKNTARLLVFVSSKKIMKLIEIQKFEYVTIPHRYQVSKIYLQH